jgi:hypothetical protein
MSAYFDYMRADDTIDYQKLEDHLTVNAACDNQSAVNAVKNILLSHW